MNRNLWLAVLMIFSGPAFAVGGGTGADTCREPVTTTPILTQRTESVIGARLTARAVRRDCETFRGVPFVIRSVQLDLAAPSLDLRNHEVIAKILSVNFSGIARTTLIRLQADGNPSLASAEANGPIELTDLVHRNLHHEEPVEISVLVDGNRILTATLSE